MKELVLLRQKLKLSQMDIARFTGYAVQWITACETGRREAGRKLKERYKLILDNYALFLHNIEQYKKPKNTKRLIKKEV